MSYAYTRPFARQTLPAGVSTVLNTVPDGRVWVIRDVTLYNGSVATLTFYLQVVHQGETITLLTGTLETATATHVDLRQAMVRGEQLVAFSTEASQISVTGYDLNET